MKKESRKFKKSKIVKVGIAGLGRSGWDIHVRLLDPLKTRYKIVAVFDKEIKRQQEAIERFDCRAYGTFTSFLKDEETELVVVAMPNYMHADCSIAALEAGKDVVCEKPMATSLKDADKMIASARRTGQLLTIFQNRRYSPDFVVVRKVIESGLLGRIVHIRMAYHSFKRRWDWQTLKRFGGGELNNTCPHPLDQALVFFGKEQPQVFCLLDKTLTLGDTDDHVKIILSAKNTPTVEIEITSACAYPQENWLVMGTQGSLSGTFNSLRWKYFNPKRLPKRTVDERPTSDRSYNSETIPFTEKIWDAQKDKSPGEKGFYLDLYQALRHEKPLTITPESVRRQMWVKEQCRKTASI